MLLVNRYAVPVIWEAKPDSVIQPVEFKSSLFGKFARSKTLNQKPWVRDLKAYRNLRYEILRGLKHDWS